jgi:2-polyprenyl-6-methoxyphenol hydroxylase-like FAD-dependent oxidoreductase
MQEVLLEAAAEAGAEVRRGATVRDVKPGAPPTVVVTQNGQTEEVHARLVIGADGRTSLLRKWGDFAVHRDPDCRLVAGVLFENMSAPSDTSYIIFNPGLGQTVPLFPQGDDRVRAYFVYQKSGEHRLQGADDIPRFIAESIRTGAPAEFYAEARAIGPLATFDAADTWVDHPYREGIALVGDAAASNDPSFGEGLSLTVRDVRVLRDHLLSHDNWDAAGHAYAEEHDRHYGVIHTVSGWFGEMFFAVGPEADARRERALPLIAQDESRVPDHIVSGPDLPVDEGVRRHFFGEE